MKGYRYIAAAAAMALMCGCSGDNINEVTTTEASEITYETTQQTTTESISVTFAETEPEITEAAMTETAVPETEVTETEVTVPLKENQIEYRDNNVSVLMEFTGAEELKYYPRAAKLSEYRDYYYVLHSYFTVENLSEKSFDFIPQKMIIYGRKNNSRWDMMPITEKDTGLEAADSFYTIESGKSVSFNVDFIGEKKCIENANEIKYAYELYCGTDNIDYKTLNNVNLAGGVHLDNRTAVKKAVSAALTAQAEKTTAPKALTPKDGEYSVTTPKNSYCFTVESINNGSYIKVSLRLQCLTGEAEVFEPDMFRLTQKGGDDCMPHEWHFDEELVKSLPETCEIEGVSDTLYGYPFDLYIRPDGSAEYDMYFFTANDNVEDYYMFSYNGKNDVFESIIKIR
ncbi:MAG: hypothetical protein ACI4SF_08465 [Oscillospiraceae bacterium]